MPWLTRWLRRAPVGGEPPACLGCGGALELQTFAVCQAAFGRITASVFGLPFRACTRGCADRRFTAAAFAAATVEAVVQGGGVPVARVDANGSLHCRRCMSRQFRPGVTRGSVEGYVQLPDVPGFTVRLTGPVRECANCGYVQLEHSEATVYDLDAALTETYRAAGLRTRFR